MSSTPRRTRRGVLDATEARAIAHVFGDAAPVVTSIKGALGESGASGRAACAAAFLCGAVGEVPPIAGLSEPCCQGGGCAWRVSARATDGPVVLINSFASGGALFSVVLRVARRMAAGACRVSFDSCSLATSR